MFHRSRSRSIKLHTPETKKRAIAHFYRPCTIYPYVEPSFAFSNQVGGAEVHTEQGLGWSLSGDKGQVGVTIKVPRPHWVAGQQVWLDITVNNKSSRKIKTMTLALLSTVILFTPPASNGQSSTMSPDLAKYPGRSTRKKLFEQTTEASGGSGSGYVGSRGWWTGVQPGECIRWQSSLTLPVSPYGNPTLATSLTPPIFLGGMLDDHSIETDRRVLCYSPYFEWIDSPGYSHFYPQLHVHRPSSYLCILRWSAKVLRPTDGK